MSLIDINKVLYSFSGLSALGIITLIFAVSIALLSIYILANLYNGNRRASKFERWKFLADTLIRNAIFYEEDDSVTSPVAILKVLKVHTFPIPERVKKLLVDPHFRTLIIKELVAARQNMSGAAASNLKNLFKQLKLHDDSIGMIKGNSWYLKASGIQYLGIMEMAEYKDLIFPYTNNNRGLVRVEAQNAIVKFSGFEGLRFLDQASFQITEWQQIKLLEELAQLPGENFTGIDKWLASPNDSVVIFALKLARNYFRFELYNNVIACLNHKNPEVRRHAILAAKELQTFTTASDLIKFYDLENERNKLAIIYVLEDLRSEVEIPFLISVFKTENNQLKIAAVKAIAAVRGGLEQLEADEIAVQSPYLEIIRQVKSEKK